MYVYILICSDKSYYVGVTNNIEKRVDEHNFGIDNKCYTFSRRPVQLVYYNKCQSPRQAIDLEKKLKGWSRAKKEALISGELTLLRDLSKCKNETSHLNKKK